MDDGSQVAGDKTRKSASALGADEIIPRDIRFGILENRQRHWYGGDPVKTAVIDGLSMFLPEGERFFIRSLKAYANSVGDVELQREINGYAVQEAFHTREHEEYNRALTELGYPTDVLEAPIKASLRRPLSNVVRLAVTCAIEHITATFSSVTLRDQRIFADAAPAYRRLWMWHALEELEHKAVALDVFNNATRNVAPWKRYLLRVGAMNATIIPFMFLSIRNIRLFAKADGIRTGVGFWLHFLKVVFISPGFWTRSLIPLLRYYKPGFDPRNVDDVDLIHKGRDWLEGELPALYANQPRAAR